MNILNFLSRNFLRILIILYILKTHNPLTFWSYVSILILIWWMVLPYVLEYFEIIKNLKKMNYELTGVIDEKAMKELNLNPEEFEDVF